MTTGVSLRIGVLGSGQHWPDRTRQRWMRAGSGAPIDPAIDYVYLPERGPVPAGSAPGDLRVRGRTLLDMAADDYTRGETRDEARVLMRALIALRLGPQPLHTRNVMMELQEL